MLGLARTAAMAGNAQETYDYAARVLEVNPKSVDAWILKAGATGWLSTLQTLRIHEMVVNYRAALWMAEEEGYDVYREVISGIEGAALAAYEMSLAHVEEFPYEEFFLSHIRRCAEIVEALEFAAELDPTNIDHLNHCIAIASSLIQGVRYKLPNGTVGLLHLSPEREALWQAPIDGWSATIRTIQPGFVTPTPKAEGSGDCFVITAAMGADDAWPVTYLRSFRDSILTRSELGRRAIDVYYLKGPAVAARIAPSRLCRAAAFALIVIPALTFAFLARLALSLWAKIR